MANTDFPSRAAATDLARDQDMAESLRRRDESIRNVLVTEAERSGNEELQARAQEFDDRLTNSAQRRDEMVTRVPPVDPEGTAPTLADRAGNFAPSAEIASAGGTGVDASNTNVDSGEVAQSADEAGVQTLTGGIPAIGRGGQVDDGSLAADRAAEAFPDAQLEEGLPGGPAPAGDRPQVQRQGAQATANQGTDIPENWQDMPFTQRRNLAQRYADGAPVRSGEDADQLIRAELDRRRQSDATRPVDA